MRRAALIVAAGRGERMGAPRPKALLELRGVSLLGHVLDRFSCSKTVDEVVVVAPLSGIERCREIAAAFRPVAEVVRGGDRRQDSVRLGLAAVGEGCEIVVVHDAARPLVSPDLIRRTVETAERAGAAIAALAVADSVKEVDGRGVVVGHPSRERLWLAQTPQVFRADVLREAHRRALADGIEATDDAALVARLGIAVHVVPGEPSNLKVTTVDDFRLAEAWLAAVDAG